VVKRCATNRRVAGSGLEDVANQGVGMSANRPSDAT